MRFHPLPDETALPARLNSPFRYQPHGLCLLAAHELQEYLASTLGTGCEGKMFGVLLVSDADGRPGYLAAYSGQQEGLDDSFFVPAVFDYLQPDGYFKRRERKIVEMGHEIAILEQREDLALARKRLRQLEIEAKAAIAEKQNVMREAKRRRDERRARWPELTAEEQAAMLRESQYLKAEVRRAKLRYKPLLATAWAEVSRMEQEIEALKRKRHEASDRLQRWLFSQFLMRNGRGEERPLPEIFSDYYRLHTKIPPSTLPPSGSGECCEPKLLQYAFLHGMRPRQIAMFWWGRSPEAEVRHHGQFYPACQGKCRPLLSWMLQGVNVEEEKTEAKALEPEVVYEDEYIAVVNKPAGLLSVPGKGPEPSVLSWARERYADKQPMLPHRLDMDTSGLLIIALNKEAYVGLQRQFRDHEVRKHYVALLDGVPQEREGIIDLPLTADEQDRPRQKVDFEKGLPSRTRYIIRWVKDGRALVDLYPETGRTHQLRLHCAHHEGLGIPIVGDRLYGKAGARLHLHAAEIEFEHPITQNPLSFSSPISFFLLSLHHQTEQL